MRCQARDVTGKGKGQVERWGRGVGLMWNGQ